MHLTSFYIKNQKGGVKSDYTLYYLLFCFFSLVIITFGCTKENDQVISPEHSSHPRILLLEGEEELIQSLVDNVPTWAKMHSAILKNSNKILGKSPPERTLIGRRLLSTSREYLRRIFHLSYAYRMTEDERFLSHAEAHLLKAASFSDWNPSHFLDVAEMTMGMAIGYDWLYHQLSAESRKTISSAISNKGLSPSFDSQNNRFLTATHNWNQVCNAGMVYGALAIDEESPLLRTSIINRALESVPRAMKDYGPDGAYPEGYGYWGYGTTMNVMMLSALQRLDYDVNKLIDLPGFLETPEFMMHMLGPSGSCFNWGDNSDRGRLNPAMFWFAEERDDPSILWSEKTFLEIDDYSKFTGERLLPAILIWSKSINMNQVAEPRSTSWMGDGKNPVAIMRTSWTDPDAIYVGFKAGSPSVNHGHMDIGSFVLESNGVRWVSDLGVQNYESLESKGISVFGKSQTAQRWTIFRMNNFSHSTLTINNKLQRVDGLAKIDRFSNESQFSFAISDLTSVYQGQLAKVVRGIGIKNQSHVVLRDEVQTLDQETTLRWNLVTFAEPQIKEDVIVLQQGNEQLMIRIFGPEQLQLKTWSTAPTNHYDAENPGSIMVGFEVKLPPNHAEFFEVVFIPKNTDEEILAPGLSLDDW